MRTLSRLLPPGYILRPPANSDIDAIVRMIAASEIFLHGESDASAEDVRFTWGWPRFDLARDAWLLFGPRGSLLGYGRVWGPRLPHSECDGWLHLSPDATDLEVGAELIRIMEARSLERIAAAGTAGARTLAIPAAAQDARMLGLLAAGGYRPIRTFFRMELALGDNGARAEVDWPPGTEVSPFQRGEDETAVYETIQESFADHFRFMPESLEDWSRRSYGHSDFAPSLTFLVRSEGRVVAVSLNYRSPAEGWIGMLGVRRAWRHRGLGRALLLHSFAAFHRAGCRKALLGVDSENADGATRLYESLGMKVTRRHLLHERALTD